MIDPTDLVARATADLQRAQREADFAAARLAKANADVADLGAFLRTLDRYIESSVLETKTGDREQHIGEHAENGTRKWSSQPGTMARKLVDAAMERINETGKPQTIGELLTHILSIGLTVGGADQKSNLAGYLSRDPRVTSLGGRQGWVIKTEGAATAPASHEAAPSSAEGESDDRPTLASPGGESEDEVARRLFT